MIKTQRLASVAAMAVLAVSMTACSGSSSSSSNGNVPAAPAPNSSAAAAASDGVTTPADVFGAACSQLPQGTSPGGLEAMGPQKVATAASTNPLLTTLVTAVKAAGLVDSLNSQTAISVFAPSNGAFDDLKKAVGDAKFTALLGSPGELTRVLAYHVIPTRMDRAGMVSAGSVTTLAGGTLQIKDAGPTITVTDGSGATANVLCGNIPTANATVFVIDKVLMATKS